jgi:hypothetical protein
MAGSGSAHAGWQPRLRTRDPSAVRGRRQLGRAVSVPTVWVAAGGSDEAAVDGFGCVEECTEERVQPINVAAANPHVTPTNGRPFTRVRRPRALIGSTHEV